MRSGKPMVQRSATSEIKKTQKVVGATVSLPEFPIAMLLVLQPVARNAEPRWQVIVGT
jgi:hypothetical protein